ncbi:MULTISPECIES: DUF1127 domain-containing protein [Pseudomonas]|nr:DUF1127 domain-containing protein [uncultured Pseudomonas sp.]
MNRVLAPFRSSAGSRLDARSLWRKIAGRIAMYLQNARTRHQLAQLGERELADAGIDRCQRARELSKPFWR